MNILLINHYAGSPTYGMEFRPYYLAREWVKQGHQVWIVGASYSHLRISQPVVHEGLAAEKVDGITYLWIKTPSYNSSLKRICNMLSFVNKLRKHAGKINAIVQPNLVVASSTYPIDIYPAKKIATLSHAKLTYEVHDLWPLSPMLIGGYKKWHPFVLAMQKGENDAYKYSDKVVSLLWNAEKHMREHGLEEGKFICIPNGYCESEWDIESFQKKLPQEHDNTFNHLKNKIIVGFAGGFAASGALMTLLRAADTLRDNSEIHFVLIGKGIEENSLKAFAKSHQLSNVTFLSAVSKNLIAAIISRFSIAYFGGIHSVLHQYGTSANKMTDYMLSGKPIVQAIDEPGSIIEQVGCGIRVEAENPQASADAILKISNMSEKERETMGNKGKEYARRNLEWGTLAKKFISAFND